MRAIYKYALDKLPKESCQTLYKNYTVHEKKYGDRAAIEDVIVSKRRFQYEEVWKRLFMCWLLWQHALGLCSLSHIASDSAVCYYYCFIITVVHRFQEIKKNSFNYDAWFDYIRLLENDGSPEQVLVIKWQLDQSLDDTEYLLCIVDVNQVREVYERAIANVPPSQEKRFWRRYIYIWINYALYEELEMQVNLRLHCLRL